MNLSKVTNVVIEGIDYKDYPDFCDAYIVSADYYGEPMTEQQLNELNENGEFIHESVMNKLF
jgi:hypothetical protein